MESVNFDRAAGFYDATRALPAATMAELTGLLAAEFAGRQPCLEIGVGTGRFALPLREAARRHGLVRKPFGAQAPPAVADYLAGRATARELNPVAVRTVWTLGEAIEHVERQLFSWSWPFTPAQAAAVADEMRAWAAVTGLPLETAHETETAVRCWAFELRS